MSHGVSHRHDLDLALLWLCCRLAAVAPYATGAAQKSKKKKKKRHVSTFEYQSSFTALRILCAPPLCPLPATSWQPLIIPCLRSFCLFQNLESHSKLPFQIGFFHVVVGV